jgi:hypothetical protein
MQRKYYLTCGRLLHSLAVGEVETAAERTAEKAAERTAEKAAERMAEKAAERAGGEAETWMAQSFARAGNVRRSQCDVVGAE